MEIGASAASAIQGADEMRVWETSQQAKCSVGRRGVLRERLSVPYACYVTYHMTKQGKDGNGMEEKQKIKNGHIVVKNPLFQELPKHEIAIKSSRTLYRFTGSYDGERSLPHKVLRLMEQEKAKKDVD